MLHTLKLSKSIRPFERYDYNFPSVIVYTITEAMGPPLYPIRIRFCTPSKPLWSMSCPPPSPEVCPQVCPPTPQPPPCRVKPVMKGLHLKQTIRRLWEVGFLCAVAGTCVYFFIGVPRKAAYRDFYARGEFEDWEDEMARKGLFQSVPKESLKDNQHRK